jgi:hypothetical protein
MKFICLGLMDERKWDAMSKSEQDAMVEECLTYDDELLASGHWVGLGGSLQSSQRAKTLRQRAGKLIVSDGPFAETKEQLGGFGVFEAKDIDEAAALMSKHPGLRFGTFEIRPIDEEMTDRCQPKTTPSKGPAGGKKFVCMAYGDEANWNALSASQRDALIEECITYGETRLKHAGWVGGVALQQASTAKTLRSKGGKVLVTDGPYAETKEQLGGVAIFTFRDMDDAVASWSQHACLRVGDTLEVRPADEDFDALLEARQQRALAKSGAAFS